MQRLATSLRGAPLAAATLLASSSMMMRRPASAANVSEVSSALTLKDDCIAASCSALSSSLVCAEQRRGRFYRPALDSGYHLFKLRWGFVRKVQRSFIFQNKSPTRRPLLEKSYNNYFGRKRLWNPIVSKIGLVNKKASDWGYPERRPPLIGIRKSQENFPFFFEKYFPAEECRLVVDSVLNTDTKTPVFQFPPHVSKREITNYLRNVYGLDNIIRVTTKNVRGRYFKNEVGKIKQLPDYKEARVTLDASVRVDFKQIKGTEDTADNQKKLT